MRADGGYLVPKEFMPAFRRFIKYGAIIVGGPYPRIGHRWGNVYHVGDGIYMTLENWREDFTERLDAAMRRNGLK